MFVKTLKCVKCGISHKPAKGLYLCRRCGGKLDIIYDYDKISEKVNKKELEKRERGMWKYKEFLPIENIKNIVTLGEGGTPLIKAKNLSEKIGVKHIFLKDETRNPTGSFKDRPMSVGVSKAVEFGADSVVAASSGNAAIALAAYSARAKINCYAFVPTDVSTAKIAQLSIYGAKVIKSIAKGKEDPCYQLMKIGRDRYGWHPVPSCGAFNPYQPEGSKTIAYEICEQLGFQVPDWVFIPMGAGTLLSGNAKGYFEFKDLDFIDTLPRLAGIQAEGCAPIVKGFKEDIDPYDIPIWENPHTVAGGLIDPYPWDADTAIPAIKKTKGVAEQVTDDDILFAEKLLGKTEGIFAEPSGAAGVAGLKKLVETGVIDRGDTVVIEITGAGLKDQKVAMELAQKPLEIQPDIEELERVIRDTENLSRVQWLSLE